MRSAAGNVLATVCDLTIASDKAVFGARSGPRVGSGRSGLGPPLSVAPRRREKRGARDLVSVPALHCRRSLWDGPSFNKVVPADELDAEVEAWCQEILALSPTAIAIAKRSFNADSENIRGIGALGFEALALYYDTEEATRRGRRPFSTKRRPAIFRAKRAK